MAAWSAARGDLPKADLVVAHLAPTGPCTRQRLDDYATSCACLAQAMGKAGSDVLVLVPTACGRWAPLEVAAALKAVDDDLSAVAVVALAAGDSGGAPAGPAADDLRLGAAAEWTTRGLAVRLVVGCEQAAGGQVKVRAFGGAAVQPAGVAYDLRAGRAESFPLLLPGFRRPDVAVSDAALRAAVADGPLELLVSAGERGAERRVRAYCDPLTVWVRRSRELASQYRLPLHLRVRSSASGPLMAEVKATLPGWATARTVREVLALPGRSTTTCPPLQLPLPAAAVGRPVQLVVELRGERQSPVYAMAEADLLRAGQCANLEQAAIDGELGEWRGRLFAPVGEPRENGRRLEFASGWDADRLYLAARAQGAEPAGQRLALLVDAREARLLGTPGGGVHLHAVLEADGSVSVVQPGGDKKLSAAGAWKGDAQSWRLELALPRTLLEAAAWSEREMDIGFNITWPAASPDEAPLIWSDGGEDGSSRSCGLLRRSTSLTLQPTLRDLPLLVRWR